MAETVCVPIFSQIGRPGSIGSSFIQTRSPRTGRPLRRIFGAAITSPREQSISSASVSVTDCPATASSRSPSNVTMRATVLVLPEGRTRTLSPGAIVPVATSPANPRKSRSGRLTHCTGMRNGLPGSRSHRPPPFPDARSALGPVVPGRVRRMRAMILSPLKRRNRNGDEIFDADALRRSRDSRRRYRRNLLS